LAEDFVIEMLHITKEFPGIKANDDITLQLRKGEVHALLGENGAGKSTLMSVLFGLYQPEAGKILKNGKEVAIRNPNDANALGIGMVHQHFKLVECFSVLDNIILGVEPNKMGFLQKAEARKKVMALSKKYGLRVDPDALVSDISVGMQQRVEILKMLYRDNEILIFDEPTAVLTPQEIDELMEIMRGFKKEGKSILFITHKLNEIMAVADRCTVLRKGKYMGTVDIKDTTKEELSRMMVGRDVQLQVDKKPAKPGKVVLDVENVTMQSPQHKKDAVRNVSFQVIAREIDKDPTLLVAVQPTRGLDVGAIEYIHRQIVAERDKGKAVLLVSLELDEVMNLSDRILVMYEGEIVGEFDPKTTTVQELGLYMAGARKQGKGE